MKERDLLLDNARALLMIHIVCVIHVMYFMYLGSEWARSILLFEMPCIFFVAGASQSLHSHQKSFWEMVWNRAKRLLLPYYAFLVVLTLLLLLSSAAGMPLADIRSFTATDIIKMLLTGGTNKIPFYGYTWFISIYFIISCSLPLQSWIQEHINKYVYIVILMAMVTAASFITLPTGNLECKNLLVYTLFYMAGFMFYHKMPHRLLYCCATVLTAITVIGFASGIMMPMQDHKFPADYWFMIFGMAWICLFSLVLKHCRQRKWLLLDLWNRKGYDIYLYQAISYLIVTAITEKWIHGVTSELGQFTIYAILLFAINTAFAYILTFKYHRTS